MNDRIILREQGFDFLYFTRRRFDHLFGLIFKLILLILVLFILLLKVLILYIIILEDLLLLLLLLVLWDIVRLECALVVIVVVEIQSFPDAF